MSKQDHNSKSQQTPVVVTTSPNTEPPAYRNYVALISCIQREDLVMAISLMNYLPATMKVRDLVKPLAMVCAIPYQEKNTVDLINAMIAHGACITEPRIKAVNPNECVFERNPNFATEPMNSYMQLNGVSRTYVPLCVALEHGNYQLVNTFNFGSVGQDGAGRMPWYYASTAKCIDAIAGKRGWFKEAAVHTVDDYGMTPLHVAVQQNYVEAASRWLDYGADIHACVIDGFGDKWRRNQPRHQFVGQTPLSLASSDDMVYMLMERGAKPFEKSTTNKQTINQ